MSSQCAAPQQLGDDVGAPVVLALNMTDLAEKSGTTVDAERLSAEFGIPVVPTLASKRQGIHELKAAVRAGLGADAPSTPCTLPTPLELEEMRGLQERLLTMLGVSQVMTASDDSMSGGVDDVRARLGEAAGVIMTPPPDVWPVEGYVTDEYEAGNIANGVMPHYGIDLVAPVDSPVRSSGRGIVQNVGWDDDLGNYVEIRHGFGYVTIYGHCSRLFVQAGDRVDAGQEIAALGGTGRASAPHLHFEIWRDGEAVDPRIVIPGDPGS